MALKVEEVIRFWNEDEPKYKQLGEQVYTFIKSRITDYELLPEISYRTKELLSIIKKIKKKKSIKAYSYNDLKDKLGIRIICTYKEEMEIIDTFLKDNFSIKKAEYKRDDLDYNRLDYVSNHYDASINSEIDFFNESKDFENFVFEIQVRTLNQHAWSNTAHSLAYKQDKDLPNRLKRKVYRLLSLYEIADDEFSSVHKAIEKDPDNIIVAVLRKLEGKFYRYAKVDFDRETSFNYIKIILDYIESKETKTKLVKNLEKFIKNQNEKINKIFDDNRHRFYEIFFLSQPEILLVWYLLNEIPFTIEDNWGNDFNSDDLEQIKTLWGNNFD